MNSFPLILVVGASGKFAGHLVPALVRRGARVRGMVHDAANEGEGFVIMGLWRRLSPTSTPLTAWRGHSTVSIGYSILRLPSCQAKRWC